MDAEYAGCRVLSIFLSVSMLGAFLSVFLSIFHSLHTGCGMRVERRAWSELSREGALTVYYMYR